MKTNHVTLDNYVMSMIKNNTSLFFDKSYEQARIRVLGYLINSINTGSNEQIELTDTSITMHDIKPYVSGEKLYYGYTDTIECNVPKSDITYKFPNMSSSLKEPVLDSARHKYPEVKVWDEVSYHEHIPYPNFLEQYSIVYTCTEFYDLDRSFIEGAVEYYKFCLDFFNNNESKYSRVFPCETDKETERHLAQVKMTLDGLTSEEIIESYGCAYNGDVYQFEVDRWNKEKLRIINFINKTIDKLQGYLSDV